MNSDIYAKGLTDIWKKNMLKDIEIEKLKFISTGNFLTKLKKKFGRGDSKSAKVAKLKKVEQESKTMEKFVQEFGRIARKSRYKEKILVEKLKRRMNGVIRRKLMETEQSLRSIEQWYERVKNLDRHRRESKREEKILRERKKSNN